MPASALVRLPAPVTKPLTARVLPLGTFQVWFAPRARLALIVLVALAKEVTEMALPGVTAASAPLVEAAVPEVLLRVMMLEAPAMVTAALSLKVMLPRFMSERPVVTLACWVAPVAPKMTLTALPPGTTPPAAVPAASVAQLLVVPLDRVIAPRAPVSCPPSQ